MHWKEIFIKRFFFFNKSPKQNVDLITFIIRIYDLNIKTKLNSETVILNILQYIFQLNEE